ncbi:MAG: MBL fold metallo-hydrolase [Evtepia sp.]|uniref:MBL fold metallo-hydrolase n=1 Tax=Evtepia sp. TaxID=2773933 RepID=UPI002A75EC35|nr:MBL fold metallo-hydrolase [Evtepia sp.]MDY3014767.1 MBL fold metallo-hydrolase [Evtepia sp.]
MQAAAITPRVWHMEEDYRDYCTLVVGETQAILWDTGQEKGDLPAFVRAHTDLPCLVLNSHGHSDHIGGNHRFPVVYAHPADWYLLEAQAFLTSQREPAYAIEPLEPGLVFDLGGLHGRVVSLAGHTRGSMGLLLEEERLLLAGDGLNPTLLMLGQETDTLARLGQTLEESLTLPFDRYLSSHSPRPYLRRMVEVHRRHWLRFMEEPPQEEGPYGPKVCRSLYKEGSARSVFLVDRRLLSGNEPT